MKRYIFVLAFYTISLVFNEGDIVAQVQASGFGFNYFDREAIADAGDGAGYSFYAGVWPIMQQYPGAENFQLGLPSTWLKPFFAGDEPDDYYNTIEGGLGWWHDTRFATATPKFIMGGVAYNFDQWANGVGAGSSDLLPDGHRNWSEPGGKYGVAQLSPYLLWPPDGLNMAQGANGEFLGYGYHPLPLTDPMAQTKGVDFSTGNQCWTLFLNTTNFKGPATFFLPTFWTETVLDDPSLEGLFFDTKPSDKNPAFAMEYAESPALIGTDDAGENYARVLPLLYPKTEEDRSELIRDLTVYSKAAKWEAVENWFNDGAVPVTEFQTAAASQLLFDVDPAVDGSIGTFETNSFEAMIDYDSFAEKVMNDSRTVAGFSWNDNIVTGIGENLIMPEFYRLNQNNLWEPIEESTVPPSTGLQTSTPPITPRSDEVPYLTPLEPDCHLQDPQSPWNSPGPAAGPFKAELGDGSILTYYWYRFVDQPAIVHADLSTVMRQNLQERVEKMHTHWGPEDEYLPAPTGGTLVGLDPGLLVSPPEGMAVGYVPIVTRQEKNTITTSAPALEKKEEVVLYPNPTSNFLHVEAKGEAISKVQLFSVQGKLLGVWDGLTSQRLTLPLKEQSPGIYFLTITQRNGLISSHRFVKVPDLN